MHLVIRGHPLDRMQERGITREDVDFALANWHTTWTDSANNSTVYIGPTSSGNDLKVCILAPGELVDGAILKTVMWK